MMKTILTLLIAVALLPQAKADGAPVSISHPRQTGKGVDVQAIAIERYNDTNWTQNAGRRRYLPPYNAQTHRMELKPVDASVIRELKLEHADLSHAVCVTIRKARQKPTLGGGTFYCIINAQTGDIITSARSR